MELPICCNLRSCACGWRAAVRNWTILAQAIGYEGLKRKLAELEEQTTAPGFWNDVERSQKNQVETARVKGKIEGWDRLDALYGDTLTLIELADEEEDESGLRGGARGRREV